MSFTFEKVFIIEKTSLENKIPIQVGLFSKNLGQYKNQVNKAKTAMQKFISEKLWPQSNVSLGAEIPPNLALLIF